MWIDLAPGGLGPDTLRLLEQEPEEFEAVFGEPVRFGPRGDAGAAWVVEPRRRPDDVPSLSWDAGTRTLTSYAEGPHDVMATMNLLHTLARRGGGTVELRAPQDARAAAVLVRDEVLATFPAFELRGIDRDAWAAHVETAPPTWNAFTPWAQEWVARLGDTHTAVIDHGQGGHNPPYLGTVVDEGVRLDDVPAWSDAHRAGVRPGWVVRVGDVATWRRTTGATPAQHDRVAARRALAMPGASRTFTASHPTSGQDAQWQEVRREPVLDRVLEHTRRPDGTLVLRLRAFIAGIGIEDAFDDLLAGGSAGDELVLDLRGNTGGNLVLATGLRDRFLREPTRIGQVAFTTGRGGLAERRDRWARPSTRRRWPGRLTVEVDAMTYSAAEDFVLGLQGLQHVSVRGQRTGGGSGRPRSIPLGPGLDLRISTAITYDRDGRPVEFRGIHPDAAPAGEAFE